MQKQNTKHKYKTQIQNTDTKHKHITQNKIKYINTNTKFKLESTNKKFNKESTKKYIKRKNTKMYQCNNCDYKSRSTWCINRHSLKKHGSGRAPITYRESGPDVGPAPAYKSNIHI